MKKLAMFAAVLAAIPSLVMSAPVFADSPGSLATGPDLYQVKNVTKGSAYGSTATATCGDVLKYSIKLANSEFGLLTNVTVKAPLNGTMTASATNAANQTTSVSGSVAVTVSQGNLVYVPGSTQNLNVSGGLIKTLPDGITAGGVNKGNLNGSTREFVQFQAKVDCPTTPPKECKPGIPVGDARCVEVPVTPTTPATPQVLAATGPVETIAQIVGVTALAGAISYYIRSRRANILG